MTVADRPFDTGAATTSASLGRLDTYPYRHRVRDVMSAPLITAPGDMPLHAACRLMRQHGVSALVTLDAFGRLAGIVTERDVVRAIAESPAGALDTRLATVMSGPVHTVPVDAFVYVALGRMNRLNLRHLVAVDANDKAAGMVTQRGLLRLRSASALMLGDQVAAARNAAELASARTALPELAKQMLAEGVGGSGVAAVIAAVVREMTARCTEIAVRDMAEAGWGQAPAEWCVLVLGSGGRGESLLAADQDNAIIHRGGDSDDPWYAEAGRRLSDLLDAAGIPLCKGGVMARNQTWRHSLASWRAQVERWIREKEKESLLNVDIFFDFQAVHGSSALAQELRVFALHGATSPIFLRVLAADLEGQASQIGVFGRIRTKEGRFDIKLGGLFPLVAAARILALKHGVEAQSTRDRVAGLAARGVVNENDAAGLSEAHDFLMQILLDQQVADIAAGLAPSVRVEPRRLDPRRRQRLKEALRQADVAALTVRGALGA